MPTWAPAWGFVLVILLLVLILLASTGHLKL